MNAPAPRRYNPLLTQWVLLGLALLALGGLAGSNLWTERSGIQAREHSRLLFQTQIIQQILDARLHSVDAALETLRQDWRRGPVDGRDMDHRLEILDEALAGVHILVILDSQGRCRAASRAELRGLDLSQQGYFQTARQNPDPKMLYVSPPFRNLFGAFSVSMTKIIQGTDGGFAGVVSTTLDPEFFLPLLQSVNYAPDMRSALIHGDGVLFLAAPERQGLVGANLDQPGSFFRRHRDSGQAACVLTGTAYSTGEERTLAARTIRPVGLRLDKTLEVTVSRDTAEIFRHWNRSAVLQGGLLAVLALVSCLGLFGSQRRQRAHDRDLARSAQALADSERFVRTVVNSIPGLVAYWDEGLRCVYANQAYVEWFGRTPEQMQGIAIQELLGEELFRKNEPFIRAALRGEPQHFERTLTKADGSTGYTLARYIPDLHHGRVHGIFVLAADVTELKTMQQELERRVQELDILAATDALTGLPNRRHFLARAGEELERSRRYGLPLVFLMLDIDHFKAVNDTHGHDAGDEVLKSLAATLREALRATDLLGRLGGEEFAALLIQTELAGARLIAERLRQTLEQAVVKTGAGPIRFTVSVGLAAGAGSGDSLEEIMKRADLALYNAKETGRNQVCAFGEF